MGELGALLRETREQKGLSLADAEEVTRIREQYLRALEEEDFSALPGAIFARGFLRNYATYLGLDPQKVVAMYVGRPGSPDGSGPTAARIPADYMTFESVDLSMRRPPLISLDLIIGMLLILGLTVIGGWWAYHQYLVPILTVTPASNQPTPMPTSAVLSIPPTITPTPTNIPTNTPTVTPPPPFYTGVTIELVITERAWIQVQVDGVKVFEGILEAGERRNWTGEERVVVRCGNAGGVEVIVNGQSQGLLGERGQVVDREWQKAPAPGEVSPTAAVEATNTPPKPPPPPDTPTPTATP
jgi:cytoskeletal protein RodZ